MKAYSNHVVFTSVSPQTGVCFRIVGRGKCGWTALQGKQRSPLDQSLPNDVCVTTPFVSSTTPATPTTSTRNGPQRISTADEHHAEEYESGTALRPKPAAEAAKSELALQFTGKEVYLDETVYLVGSKNGEFSDRHVCRHNSLVAFLIVERDCDSLCVRELWLQPARVCVRIVHDRCGVYIHML